MTNPHCRSPAAYSRGPGTISIHSSSSPSSFSHSEMLPNSTFSRSKIRAVILSIPFLLLLLPTSIKETVFAEGRTTFMLRENPKKEEGGMEMIMSSSMIGSRPPQCKRRCLACVRCEAVQVPAIPQERRAVNGFSMIAGARDDRSNYKPVNWKCKCGNFIFNP